MKTLILLSDGSEKNRMSLNKRQALQIELALNLSEYGKKWSDIGDKLYDFATGKTDDNIVVTADQYMILVDLLNKKKLNERGIEIIFLIFWFKCVITHMAFLISTICDIFIV